MPQSSLGDLLIYLRKVCASEESSHLPDGELVARFLSNRDEAAFAILVQRHGPMVLSVCHRLLNDAHAAEDAFQATFMVLARRAASVLRNQPLAGWLHGVARRIAVRAAAQTTARQSRERRYIPMHSPTPSDDLNWQELRAVLDEEIGRLPQKYRLPVVLCYLEGQTHEKAARELGVAKSSLTTRLARARELLRGQLARRGITLSIGALTTALADNALATPMAVMLAINTVKAAASIAAGKAVVGGLLSARALLWAEQAMTGIVKAKMAVCVCVLTVGAALGGAGLAGYGAADSADPSRAEQVQMPPPKVAIQVPQKKEQVAGVDVFGDPLPEGVVGRLGTTRFRAGSSTNALAFSPNGKTIAGLGRFGFYGGSLWLWDAVTGRTLHHASTSAWGDSLAFSPDGTMLFTGYMELDQSNLRLIEVATGKVLRHLERPSESERSSLLVNLFSPDGRMVAAAGWANSGKGSPVFFWDVATGKILKVLNADKSEVDGWWSAAFSPDGKFLVTAGEGKTIFIWHVETGKVVRQLDIGEMKRVNAIAFSGNGKIFASIERANYSPHEPEDEKINDCAIRLWEFETGKQIQFLKGNLATMKAMAFSGDSRILASGGRNGVIHLWDASTGKQIRAWQAHPADICSLAFSPSGTVVASTAQGDCEVRRWEIETGKAIDPSSGHSGTVEISRFARDGKSLLTVGLDARAVEWDLTTFGERGRTHKGHMGPAKDGWHARAIDLSPDGKTVAVAGVWWTQLMPTPDPVLRFYESATGKQIQLISLPDNHEPRLLKFSPNGKLLISSGREGVRLWDKTSGKEQEYLTGQNEIAAFSPDGKILAVTQNSAKVILLWDIAAKKEIRRWTSEQKRVSHLLFAPDGKTLVSATSPAPQKSDPAEARVWDIATGKRLANFNGLTQVSDEAQSWSATSMAMSGNGRVLAIAVCQEIRSDGATKFPCTIQLLELTSGQKIGQFDTAQGTISSLAFAPNGRTLASAGADSTILLWDLTGQPKPAALSPKDLDTLWSDLAADASKAEKAIWKLAFAPKQSLPFLQDRMLLPPAPAEQLANLIADLDSDRYAARQEAVQALEKLGDRAEAAIWKALKNNPTLEAKQRLEQILKKQDNDVFRKLRAIEAIEHCENPAAAALLQALTNDAPNPRVAQAARAARERRSNLD